MVPHRQTRPEERVKPRSHCHLSTTPHTRAPAPACLPPRHKRIRGPIARCAPVTIHHEHLRFVPQIWFRWSESMPSQWIVEGF